MSGRHPSEPMTGGNRKEVIEEKGSVFCLDKNIAARVLPEIVVCYEENACNNVVKDICVDEGIMLVQGRFPSNKIDSCCKCFSDQCSSEVPIKAVNALMGISESKTDGITAKESFTLTGIVSMENGKKSLEERSLQRSSSERVTLVPKMDETEDSKTDEPTAKNEPQRSEPEHYTPTNVSSHFPSGFDETEPVSGRITYSGSLSVRSDGSTTSARSFAFPVLQSEWNSSSPVRMAKAGKRHARRQKSWRHTLCCCRF